MDIQSFEKKKLAIETNFNQIKAEQKEHSDKVAELDIELVKLQGEYRLLTELIEAEHAKTPKEVKEK